MIEKLEDLKRNKRVLAHGISNCTLSEIERKVDEIIDYLNELETFHAEQRKNLKKSEIKLRKGQLS